MNTRNPPQYRKVTRLKNYDYSQAGAYFITICAHERTCLFGTIEKGKMILNRFGEIVEEEWYKSESVRSEIKMDAFQVMPNHLHGIVVIVQNQTNSAEATSRSPLRRGPMPKSLGSFVGGFKSVCKTRINGIRKTPGAPVWQNNFHDHIIRNERELRRIREYIMHNPFNWQYDKDNLHSKPSQEEIVFWKNFI